MQLRDEEKTSERTYYVADLLYILPEEGHTADLLYDVRLGFLGLGRSKKINLPKTICFLMKKHQVWEVLISGTTLVKV
jgi:hypothetical protein